MAVTGYMTKVIRCRKGFLAHSLNVYSSWWRGRHGGRSLGKSHWICFLEAERERGMLVLRLPSLFIKAKTPVYGMVLLTFRMYLPTTSN